ncbi:hypothetical protein E2C01_007015 [Portunus trituberculatus]|uniref:Uncharacterized protein n=1 Tax=Portunus trituberculatus TaxID=210409 RepID=A0A5B7CWZ4_PORTR|nr:hypothetical protein [Portunus trituberculatus]
MLQGSCVVRHAAAKFEFKSASVHSVVCDHPTAKSEFRQAKICQTKDSRSEKRTTEEKYILDLTTAAIFPGYPLCGAATGL